MTTRRNQDQASSATYVLSNFEIIQSSRMHQNLANDFANVGKTAPRLVEDLLDYDLRKSAKSGKHTLVEPAPIYNESNIDPRLHASNCRHQLYRKDSQSDTLRPHEGVDPTTFRKIAAYCSICRYHFRISVDFRGWKDGQTPCSPKDFENPLHHFRVVETRSSQNSKKAFEFVAHDFACTAATCPVKVIVKITPPRLSATMIAPLINVQATLDRGQRIIEKEPLRFTGHRPIYPFQVLSNLCQYLRDAGGSDRKAIAARNKRFRLAFGDDCDTLLGYLGFKSELRASSNPQVCISLADYNLWFRIQFTKFSLQFICTTNFRFRTNMKDFGFCLSSMMGIANS